MTMQVIPELHIRLITNDTLADDFYPISAAIIVHDDETAEYITRDGTKPIAGVDWPVYRVRLSDTGETTVKLLVRIVLIQMHHKGKQELLFTNGE